MKYYHRCCRGPWHAINVTNVADPLPCLSCTTRRSLGHCFLPPCKPACVAIAAFWAIDWPLVLGAPFRALHLAVQWSSAWSRHEPSLQVSAYVASWHEHRHNTSNLTAFDRALQVLLLHECRQEGDHAAIAQTPPELLHCRLSGATHCVLKATEILVVPVNADAQPDGGHCHVQKAGTTSLADHLRRHPALGCVDGPRLHPILRKESHFHDGVLGRHQASAAWLYRHCFLLCSNC